MTSYNDGIEPIEIPDVPEFHSVVTISLGELHEMGWFDLTDSSWDFPRYSDEQHERLCAKILERFYDREIGVLPPGAWKREFLRKMREIMPRYMYLYKKLDTALDTMNANDEWYKSRYVLSDYPQSQLGGNEDYASSGTDTQYERIHDGSIIDLQAKLRDYRDVDEMVLDEIDSMFSCLITVNMNAW